MPTHPTMDPPWYAEETGFFGASYLEEYADWIGEQTTSRQVDFVETLFPDRCPGFALLDLACGNGRHSVELARRGNSVTGLDLNRSLLDRARAAARSADVGVPWIRADMRSLPFANRFDLILSLFTSFGFFPAEDEDQQVLVQVAQALKLGGRFVLDVMERDFVLEGLIENETTQFSDGTPVVHHRRFDPATKRLHHYRVVRANGRSRSWESIVRLYSTYELERLCNRAGLRIVAMYGNYDSDPPVPSNPRCIVVAEKR